MLKLFISNKNFWFGCILAMDLHFSLTFRVQYFLIYLIKGQKPDWKRERNENFPLSLLYFLKLLEHKNYAVEIFVHQFYLAIAKLFSGICHLNGTWRKYFFVIFIAIAKSLSGVCHFYEIDGVDSFRKILSYIYLKN